MSFYSPFAFLFLLSIPVIIILYLLKQRHQEHHISSLFLWNEVLKDLEANAPWQKLKRNILMILQIFAMLFLIFALSRPILNAVGAEAGNVVVVIDTSLSMQATDVKPSRIEVARDKAIDFVSNLKPGKAVTLITMGNSAVIEENVSKNRSSVIKKLKNLHATNAASNTEDAKSLISSVVKQVPGTEVVLFGDQNLDGIGVEVKFLDVSQKGENYALLLLSHAKTKNGITALSRVANYGLREAVIPLSLYVDSQVFDAQQVNVKPGETASVYWSQIPKGISSLECRIDEKDSLEADNFAYDAVNAEMTSKVMLISDKNIFIEKVLSLSGGIEFFKTTQGEEKALKGYDLYVFDGVLPETLPGDGNIMVFNPPSNQYFEVTGEIENVNPIESQDELLNYVKDFSFSIGKTKKMSIPKWGKTVLDSDKGPLIFSGQLDKSRILVFGFDIHHTDLPLTPAFPIMMTNALEWLVPSKIKNVTRVLPGESIEFHLNPKAKEVKVILPSKKTTTLAPPFPAEIFSGTEDAGQYTLMQTMPEGQSEYYFTVNVPAEKESNLAGELSKEPDNTLKVKSKGPLNTGFNLQGIAIFLVLLLLLIEWWVYSNGI